VRFAFELARFSLCVFQHKAEVLPGVLWVSVNALAFCLCVWWWHVCVCVWWGGVDGTQRNQAGGGSTWYVHAFSLMTIHHWHTHARDYRFLN
jgi:hypothetical protein